LDKISTTKKKILKKLVIFYNCLQYELGVQNFSNFIFLLKGFMGALEHHKIRKKKTLASDDEGLFKC